MCCCKTMSQRWSMCWTHMESTMTSLLEHSFLRDRPRKMMSQEKSSFPIGKMCTMKRLHRSSCPRRMESRQQSLKMRKCLPHIRCMRSHRQTARCLRYTNRL